MIDIVERLRTWLFAQPHPDAVLQDAADEIERLRAEGTVEVARLMMEVAEWKDRYEAERRDHEATIAHCEKLMNEGP